MQHRPRLSRAVALAEADVTSMAEVYVIAFDTEEKSGERTMDEVAGFDGVDQRPVRSCACTASP